MQKSLGVGIGIFKEFSMYLFGIALDQIKEHGWKASLFLVPFSLAIVVLVIMVVGVFV